MRSGSKDEPTEAFKDQNAEVENDPLANDHTLNAISQLLLELTEQGPQNKPLKKPTTLNNNQSSEDRSYIQVNFTEEELNRIADEEIKNPFRD